MEKKLLVELPPEQVEQPFLKLTYDRDELVRANACDSLCGKADGLDALIKQLQHKDYQVRVAAVRNLQEVRDEGNKLTINAALVQLSAVETSVAVRDALE